MIRKLSTFALLIALPQLGFAQEAEAPPPSAVLESTGRATQWKNWVFAGSALAAAAVGMTFIILNQGSESH